MRQPDPLDNIMNMLRRKGGTDPNSSAAQKASMKNERAQLGVQPGMVQPGQPPQQPAQQPAQQGRSQEVTDAGGMEMDPNIDDMDLVVDQMNEQIISMKRALHHTQEPQKKQEWEKRIERVRQDILEMGGEPIWADESIDEGLAKLQGRGYVGADRTATNYEEDQFIGLDDRTGSPYSQLHGHSEQEPYYGDPTRGLQSEPGPVSYHDDPMVDAGLAAPRDYSSPYTEQPTYEQDRYDWTGLPARGQVEPRQEEKDDDDPTIYSDAYTEYEGFKQRSRDVEPYDEVDAALMDIGEEEHAREQAPWETGRLTEEDINLPGWEMDDEWFTEMEEQYGMTIRDPEEVREHARSLVERQYLGKRRVIEREIERFEREHENSFAKAKNEITEAARRYKGEQESEYSGRGLLFSSIMAGTSEAIDDRVISEISEISKKAADHVMGLEAEIRDLAQWAVVEEEVLTREMMSEERDRSFQLGQMRMNVGLAKQQFELDRAYKGASMALDRRRMALDELRTQIEVEDHQARQVAAAGMINHPIINEQLRSMGITNERMQGLGLPEQSALVEQALMMAETQDKMLTNQKNRWALSVQTSVQQQRASLAEREFQFNMEQAAEADMLSDRDYMLGLQEMAPRISGTRSQIEKLESGTFESDEQRQAAFENVANSIIAIEEQAGYFEDPGLRDYYLNQANQYENRLNNLVTTEQESGSGILSNVWDTLVRPGDEDQKRQLYHRDADWTPDWTWRDVFGGGSE